MSKRKNEAKKDIDLFNFLTSNKYSKPWEVKKTTNKYIQEILDSSSKADTGKRGEPDLIYVNESNRILILLENKDSINDHESSKRNNAKNYAVDGVIHYLKFFNGEKLKPKETTAKYLHDWSIIGIAVSGDISDKYNHLISTFIISDNKISEIQIKELLNEQDYLSFFQNIDIEKITKNISTSSSEINRKLRSIDSQRRPILLSALMICLYDNGEVTNNFKSDYSRWTIANIVRNIPTTIHDILENEGITKDKIEVLINELSFINTQKDILDTDILKSILKELEDNVIPLFNKKTNYDIIGKFYEEFLRYAGVANVKKGIVLTPSHITELFTDLIEFKTNDVILDTCCGTGAFLITGMNKIIGAINDSDIADKKNQIKNVKEKQLIGFEKSSTMYSLAISNMLFRGDGKSRIYNVDTFSKDANDVLSNLRSEGIQPSIGFINPPYGGSDNTKNPTKKEIQFLEQLLDNVSRYGVIIAPVSTYFKDVTSRNRILSKHTLKAVINMPGELFQPNASTHTAIAVFETNLPHGKKEVAFYNLEEDGYVLSKNKGRTDVYNKWNALKQEMLTVISDTSIKEQTSLVRTSITKNDEWIFQAHCETDYSSISEKSFVNSIKQYVIFSTKKKLGLLDEDLDELTILEILNENNISAKEIIA